MHVALLHPEKRPLPGGGLPSGGDKDQAARPESEVEAPVSEALADAGLFVVAVVASAGGLRACTELLAALPSDFPASIAIVQHLDRRHPSLMAQILTRHTALRVQQAAAGDLISAGVVHIAPPDHHLLVGPDGVISLSQAEPVHFVRPSGDLLLESVARSFGARAIAVILTGTGSDGASGVVAIKREGGRVIAQEPQSAEHSGMPGAAVATGCADLVLPLDEIAPALVRWVVL